MVAALCVVSRVLRIQCCMFVCCDLRCGVVWCVLRLVCCAVCCAFCMLCVYALCLLWYVVRVLRMLCCVVVWCALCFWCRVACVVLGVVWCGWCVLRFVCSELFFVVVCVVCVLRHMLCVACCGWCVVLWCFVACLVDGLLCRVLYVLQLVFYDVCLLWRALCVLRILSCAFE